MSPVDRKLLRIACRLQSAYAAIRPNPREFYLPQYAWDEVQAAYRGWITAQERGWQRVAAAQRATLIGELEHFDGEIRSRLTTLRAAPPPAIPGLRLLYEELVATDEEFNGVLLEEGELSITTEPIALDDVELGRFKIRLHFERLGTEYPYSLRALEPNPAASCPDTTHPHVNCERLCAGEGRSAIAAALAEGRLLDFFTIVNRILHTYGEGSAYVELGQWYGIRCEDCGATIDAEDACACTQCEDRVCGDCLQCCGCCGDGYCAGCIDRCYLCEQYSCSDCLTTCTRCRRAVCGACHDEGVCESCREKLEEVNDESESELASPATVDAASDPAV
mgnify:FL=1